MCASVDSSFRHTLYFATNRRHVGRERWRPSRYSGKFSNDGRENLRFGKVKLRLDGDRVNSFLEKESGYSVGDGEALATHVKRTKDSASIEAYEEVLEEEQGDVGRTNVILGSRSMFEELRQNPLPDRDVLVFLHGFNVGWWDAVASATSLELTLNRNRERKVIVVLFTWPSDGRVVPFRSYFSDRDDARCSGGAVGRGFLKLRDFLLRQGRRSRAQAGEPCTRSIHLLCHSMGNYVLQNALKRTLDFCTRGRPPCIFDQIFLCAADVADDVFDPGQPFHELPGFAGDVTVYYNKGDLAMPISDHTKGNSRRLGWRGPKQQDGRIHSVDCSEVVHGLLEHSYHLSGLVKDDIAESLSGIAPGDSRRSRRPVPNGCANEWCLERPKDAAPRS